MVAAKVFSKAVYLVVSWAACLAGDLGLPTAAGKVGESELLKAVHWAVRMASRQAAQKAWMSERLVLRKACHWAPSTAVTMAFGRAAHLAKLLAASMVAAKVFLKVAYLVGS